MINNLSFHVQIACADNGLFSLTMTLLLAAAEESSKLLTANQGATHRYTTIGTASNGYAERFVGVFKLAVAERRPYHTLGDFLRAAEAWVNFYNRERPHESLGYRSPNQFAEINQLQTLPYLAVF